MSKGGGSAPKNQTTTTTATPYLKSDVSYAAQQAKNLYQGYTPQMTSLSNQISGLDQQIAAAQEAARKRAAEQASGRTGAMGSAAGSLQKCWQLILPQEL